MQGEPKGQRGLSAGGLSSRRIGLLDLSRKITKVLHAPVATLGLDHRFNAREQHGAPPREPHPVCLKNLRIANACRIASALGLRYVVQGAVQATRARLKVASALDGRLGIQCCRPAHCSNSA